MYLVVLYARRIMQSKIQYCNVYVTVRKGRGDAWIYVVVLFLIRYLY